MEMNWSSTAGFGVICEENDEHEQFIATHEWQPIKEGQKVPAGLHYRINLSTGLKEAKLIDDHDKSKTDVLAIPSKQEIENKDSTIEELKQILKNIKNDDVKREEKTSLKFRTYEQLKQELETLNLTSKVDAEILKDLIQQHKNEIDSGKPDVKIILNILDDFDYLGHQFDNGLEFVRQNGFRDVIYKNLNSTHEIVKQSTLKLFGSLVQNNARVQIHALETGSIPILLRLFPDASEVTKSNAMFALGCLLRRFPLAQQRFLDYGGTFVILQVFEKDSIKVQLKMVTLMTDLFLERRQSLKTSSQLLLNQYKNITLEEQILKQNWCIYINKLLINIIHSNQDDHDSIEKCLIGMNLVSDQCRNFNNTVLISLRNQYEHLARTESEGGDFFESIAILCSNMLKYNEKSEL